MCNSQEILDQSPCLASFPPFVVAVLMAEGLCAIATGGFGPIPPSDNAWTNPQDGGDWTNPSDGGTFTNPQP